VVVDWGRGHSKLACKIWGFLDLSNLPLHRRISAGGLNNLQPGIYAVVEASVLVQNAVNAELLREIESEVGSFGGRERYVTQLKFYLAPVDALWNQPLWFPTLAVKRTPIHGLITPVTGHSPTWTIC